MRARGPQAGFTLSEILITIAILAILASIALPGYLKAIERGYWRGAQDVLLVIYSGEQVYEAVNDTYVDPAGCVTPPPWKCVYMDNPNGGPVAYAVDNLNANISFRATATRNGKSMTIDETKVIDTKGWPQP